VTVTADPTTTTRTRTAPPIPPLARRLPWRSPADQPVWARPALLALAVLAGLSYAAGIRNGFVHGYYAPAVKSMSESWRAFWYAGYDPAASITLDKLPGAFMVEALSARVFGFSTWSILLPQVIETVVAIFVLYGVVRRWVGPAAGLFAAAAFATTPIVAALAHAEISDTLLTLLLILAADACLRAVAGARLGWLLLAGVWVGLAFQTKMVQAWGVLPALALVYLIAAPARMRRRLGHVALAGVVALAVSMSWIVMVLLTPASARPYVDGSLDNSPLAMVFEYNLLSRYGVGSDTTPGFGGPGADGTLSFMFANSVSPQVGWLYPLALIGLIAGLWWRGRAPRTDLVRAGFLMWALWLAVYTVAFSTGRVAHTFYVIAVAPAIAALAGGGLVVLWRGYRRGGWQRWLLPVSVAATVAWGVWLSRQFPTFLTWMTPLLLALGVLSAALLVAVPLANRENRSRVPRLLTARLALAGLATAVLAVLVAPTAWAVSTVDSRYGGSGIGPAAGPMPRFGARGPYGLPEGFRGPFGQRRANDRQFAGGSQPPGADQVTGGGRPPGGFGGGVQANAQAKQLIAWLQAHEPGSTYLLAVQGSNQAGQYILAGVSVLPMGGFSGQVPFPTSQQLAKLVADGQLRYVLLGGHGAPGGEGNADTTAWVKNTCTVVTDNTLGVSDLYDCARPPGVVSTNELPSLLDNSDLPTPPIMRLGASNLNTSRVLYDAPVNADSGLRTRGNGPRRAKRVRLAPGSLAALRPRRNAVYFLLRLHNISARSRLAHWPSSGTAEHCSEIVGASRDVLDGSVVLGIFAENGVLLERVQTVVSTRSQVPDDCGDVDISGSQWSIHSSLNRLAVGEMAGLHLCGNRRIHILQVQVRDPIRSLPCELGWVGTTDEQVAGVETQRDPGPVEHLLHLMPLLDHRAHMGMQNSSDAPLCGEVRDPIQVGQQGVPSIAVQLGTAVIPGATAVG
jgi:4-amino-4-deoxy-L-arabinose transferase-like glycosyltransferase